MYIEILKNCTGCGACEAINDEVFEVYKTAHVNLEKVPKNKEDCIDAAFICPVGAIWIDSI